MLRVVFKPIAISVDMLNVIRASDVILNVIMLSVTMLNVVVPLLQMVRFPESNTPTYH